MNALDIARKSKEEAPDSRTKRQWDSVIKWFQSGATGTIEACTGFGKTRIATEILKVFQRRNIPNRPVVVVVPSLALQQQWIKGLKQLGLSENTEVWVINSLIKKRRVICDLLILDEVHRYAAKTFSHVFKISNYHFILGLTATFNRIDGKQELLRRYAPIIDRIPLREARAKGWVSDYRHYNLGVTMSDEDKEKYERMKITFGRAMDMFGRNFEVMKRCAFGLEPIQRGTWTSVPSVVQFAQGLGWKGNSSQQAFRNATENKTALRGQKKSVWGNDEHTYSPKRLYVWAIIGMRAIRQMKEFVYLYPKKLSTAIELIEKLDRRTITFSQYIQTAEDIAQYFGSKAVVYHSDMKSIERKVLEEKEFKTEKGVDNFVDKNSANGWFKKKKYGRLYVQRLKNKKISATQLKREAIHKIINTNRTKIIATGKALDEGFDAPNIELGVTISRTSSELQMTQRIGRVVRSHTFSDGSIKDAVFVDIYLKDTKDKQWLQNAQRGHIGIYYVDSVEEIVRKEESLISNQSVNSAAAGTDTISALVT